MTSLNQLDIKGEPFFVEFIIVIFQLVQVNGIHTIHKDHLPSDSTSLSLSLLMTVGIATSNTLVLEVAML